jgi:dTDP-4-amino-4,6-dideoxygalactose transaminase
MCPNADRACAEVLSLPLSPVLSDADVDTVASAVSAFMKGQSACVR